ncbi:MAG TPA: hypothetical protein VJ873_11395, partial [bacterium]|nr:hypothetical protein [bacterium]
GKVPRKHRVIEDKEASFKILDAGETSVLKVKAVKRKTPLLPPAEIAPVVSKPRKKRTKMTSAEAPATGLPAVEPATETTDANIEKPT